MLLVVLQQLGSFVVRRYIAGASDTYGTFAIVIALLSWFFLVSRVILMSAEANQVLADGLSPRRLLGDGPPTDADRRATLLDVHRIQRDRTLGYALAVDGARGDERGPGAAATDQLATSRWPARPLISSSRCTAALGDAQHEARPGRGARLVGLDESTQAGGVDERDAGDVDDLDGRVAGQPVGEVGRRVAVDLALEDQRPVGVDREVETRILGRHGGPTVPAPLAVRARLAKPIARTPARAAASAADRR